MCEAHRPAPAAAQLPLQPPASLPTPPAGSRRRRVWDLPVLHHCALIGVALPAAVARRLHQRAFRSAVPCDDYDVHFALVTACRTRTRAAEAVQRELDTRHALAVRRFAAAKTVDALQTMFEQTAAQGELGAALWAGLTHPRCDDAVADAIYRHVHMHQHLAGAMARADLHRCAGLADEHAATQRELEQTRRRVVQLQAERAAQAERDAGRLLQLRGELLARDSAIVALREELEELRRAAPDLPARQRLAARVDELGERNRLLARELAEAREQQRRAERDAAVRRAAEAACAPEAAKPADEEAPSLEAVAVLCVGGRDGAVAAYRELIEQRGGRFLHHDGGREDNAHLLGTSLAAADLVVCQAGCISHNAYWLVKDHCKRTGKRCIYLERPSVSGFVRGLAGLPPDDAAAGESAPAQRRCNSIASP